ncbi:MAG: DNA-deoxyinosine glycosylase [Gammaproteobacteria bacterium]|jgi:hypoxanthine-DNA glycosylase
MDPVTCFAPIADINAVILILGSMPSTQSLEAHQYYAHPRNSFWFIMSALFADKGPLNYEQMDYKQKQQLLKRHRVALWDVVNTCQRKGSLDSSIRNDTIVVNNFNHFFAEHPLIKAVYFNGSRAQQEFNKHVLPTLDERYSLIQYQRLPSTSPAMASLSREQKLQQWKRVLEYLN